MREGTAAIAASRVRLSAIRPWLVPLIALASPAIAEMPDRSWRGVERLVVMCSIDSRRAASDPIADDRVADDELAADLCKRVVRIAAPSSPLPIDIIEEGSVSLGTPRVAALLVQASVSPASAIVPGTSGRVLSWTMRTVGTDLMDEAPSWFGAAPRLVRLGDAGMPDAAVAGDRLDVGLRESLGELLPWLRPNSFIPLEHNRGR